MEVFGEETWFRMGDRDAATNLMRTNMLKGLYKEIHQAKQKTVAVSPFIGTDAISGPAAEYIE